MHYYATSNKYLYFVCYSLLSELSSLFSYLFNAIALSVIVLKSCLDKLMQKTIFELSRINVQSLLYEYGYSANVQIAENEIVKYFLKSCLSALFNVANQFR